MPAAQRFPAPLARPVLRSQKCERRQQNVDFYQLFALAPSFALFVVAIKLLLALGADSKTLSKGTRLHKPSGHSSNCSLSGRVSPEGKRYAKPFISGRNQLPDLCAIQDLFGSC